MNHHQRHLPPGVNRALQTFSLLLLALICAREMSAMPRLLKPKTEIVGATDRGYLSTVGAPALRFQEPAAVPPSPPSPKPSVPAESVTSSPHDSSAEAASASSTPSLTLAATGETSDIDPPPEKNSPSKTKPSPQIIPDDTRAPVRPEDFLPFFQFPGPGAQTGTLNVIVPVPHQPASATPLPPSSATYTQSPK